MEACTVLTGAVEPFEKLEALADADVFVSSSEAENFGFSVFEAMASRVPVVVSDTLNYAREINSAGAGFAVNRDPECFAIRILELLGDQALRTEKGLQGMRLADSYSWSHTGIKVERAIQSVVDRHALPPDLTDPSSAGIGELAR
jgi:glycosyltransferase involved in cell wall biosynthesis